MVFWIASAGLLAPLMPDELGSYGRAMGSCPDLQQTVVGNFKMGSEEEDRRQKR
jgi:hypothetical protein